MITQRRIFEILEKGQIGDRLILRCDLFLSILIVVNLIAVCLETIDSLFLEYKTIFVVVELVSVSIFSVEYVCCAFGLVRPPQMSMGKPRHPNGLDTFLALRGLLICWLFCQAYCHYCWAGWICAGYEFCV